jgi:hypothetical protein
MNPMTDRIPDGFAYECVEPAIGRELWRGAAPGATETERNLRSEHLRICDACRLAAAVERDVASGLVDGSLMLPLRAPAGRRKRPHRKALVPALAAAATSMAAIGLLLVMVLPPLPLHEAGRDRSGADEGFLRPVEGEMISGRSPVFRWRPVPGARSYGLRVEEVGGDVVWEGATETPRIALPPEAALVQGREYRAHLETVPRDLVASGALAVRFRTGSPAAVIRYRAQAAPWPARLLVLLGLLAGLAAATVRLRDRGDRPRAAA